MTGFTPLGGLADPATLPRLDLKYRSPAASWGYTGRIGTGACVRRRRADAKRAIS